MKREVATLAAMIVVALPLGAQVRTTPPLAVKPGVMPPMPTITYGTPQPRTAARPGIAGRWEARTVTAMVGGRNVSAPILHLRGLDGIEKAQGLPDGARRLLEMHVRTLKAGEPDHYIVNTALAAEWLKTHPVPPDVKPADAPDNHSGCDAFSIHCLSEGAQHVVAQGSAEWQKLWQQAVDTWHHASGELAHDWNMAEACFADASLPLANVPVQFSITPSMTVHLEQSGSSTLGGGSASGTVQGTLGLGFPIQSDFRADIDLFYIPCLPFVVRPRSIAANGTMTVGEQLKASVSATGKFDKLFTIPPTGGPQIPIEVIPIVIAGVPVAELDVSAYIEGNVEVGGSGRADGGFEFNNPHKAAFNFACSGSGCRGDSRGIPDPTTANETASIKGQVFVKPAIYTALQLDFDVDALSARAGPQPYLLGTASGCDAVAGSQTVGGASTTSENHLLVADLDWGVDLRAEALIARQVVGDKYQHSFTGNKHLWFRDLLNGGSTALVVGLTGPAQASSGLPAALKVKMPSCYPYSNPVKYRVTWTGNATPGANPACQWQAGQGICTADPTKDLTLALTWPATGSYAVTAVVTGDDHHRVFSPEPKPTQVSVTVSAGRSGAP